MIKLWCHRIWSHRDNPWMVGALFVLLGLIGLLAYAQIPIVRNALIYGRISYSMLDLGRDFLSENHAYNKALGFPTLSVPLVWLFGANIGLKVSSFVWTALWVLSTVIFFKHLEKRFHLVKTATSPMAVAIVICFFNPLTVYQFISAYPDPLNALIFLWALYFLDRLSGPTPRRFDGVGFAILTLLAIWVKHHGFVLLAILLVFLLCRGKIWLTQWRTHRHCLIISIISIIALLGVVGMAQRGLIPLFNLSQNSGNYSGGFSRLGPVFQRNLNNISNYGWLTYSVLLPFLLWWPRFRRYKEWYLTLAIFIGTILVYHGAKYNIRYFLPISPLLAWIVAANLQRMGPRLKTSIWILFWITNGFFTAYYNNIWVHTQVNGVYRFSRHDNLRLVNEQKSRLRDLQTINQRVTSPGQLLFFARGYYRDGMWYVWERDGLFDPRLKIIYQRRLRWRQINKEMSRHSSRAALLFTKYRVRDQQSRHGIMAHKLTRRVFRLAKER